MRTSMKLITMLGGTGLTPAQQFAAYDAALGWNLSYRFNEVSGTTVVNYGSLGSGDGTWTPGAGAQGQTGQLGANQAYLYDALDSVVTGPTSAVINNASAFTYLFLVRLASTGENNAGYLVSDANQLRILSIANVASPFRINAQVVAASTNATCTTATGQGTAVNTWTTVALTYDDAGDRKPHIYFGTAASELAEATYSSQVAAVGTLSNAVGALRIGNRPDSSRTMDGLLDEFRFKNVALTLAQLKEWNRLLFL